MEFEISTDLSTIPKRIDFNARELKGWLSEKLGYYKSLIITEDDIKDAKSDRTKLNNLREAMEKKRKDIKASCLAPYNEFEKEYKSVLDMIDEPIRAIDEQLSSFETARKESKREEIKNMFYIRVPEELRDYLALPQIWNKRWLNKSYSLEKIDSEILDTVEKTSADLDVIRDLKSEFETVALEEYSRSHNLATSIALISKLKDRKKAEIKKKNLKSLEKQLQQQNAISKTDENTCTPAEQPQRTSERTAFDLPLYQLDFRVIATESQIDMLKLFMKTQHIQFMHVPKEDK